MDAPWMRFLSPTDPLASNLTDSNKNIDAQILRKTAWILLAVAINALEFFIPRIPFFPWLKPGFANCVTIIWIIEFGMVDALLFTLLRVWIVGFYFGFPFLTFTLSLSGGVCSTVAMALAWMIAGKRGFLGTIGTGVIGALVHNFAQIAVIYFLFAKNLHVFYQVPVMLIASVVFGAITGAVAPTLLTLLNNAQNRFPHSMAITHMPENKVRRRDTVVPLLLLAGSCAVAIINNIAVLVLCAVASTIAVQALSKSLVRGLLRPITRFWLMFVFIAFVHLFLSYGTKIEAIPIFTYEGARLTLIQWLRLWTWLELSFILTHLNFHEVVLYLLRRLFPLHRPTIYSGVLALEFFPATIGAMQKKRKGLMARLCRYPLSGTRKGLENLYGEVVGLMSAKEKNCY
jgi:heptaprenyl diphosphate synthase